MEHPYRTAINHVIEYDDLSSSQDLPDTFGNDVNRYIFLYKYTSYLDAIIYFMWLSYFLVHLDIPMLFHLQFGFSQFISFREEDL
jgi:hypothetical protein